MVQNGTPHQVVGNAIASDGDQLGNRARELRHFEVRRASDIQHEASMLPCIRLAGGLGEDICTHCFGVAVLDFNQSLFVALMAKREADTMGSLDVTHGLSNLPDLISFCVASLSS